MDVRTQYAIDAIEFEKKLMVAFIDQEKAFDRVYRRKLWTVLEDYGVHGNLLVCKGSIR